MSINPDNADYLSLKRAGDVIGASPRTVKRYIQAGRLPAFRFGDRNIRVRRADLDALMRPLPADSVIVVGGHDE